MQEGLFAKTVNGRELHLFTDDRIQNAINDAMSHLDYDTPVATVAHWHVDKNGRQTARLSVATRIGDSVSIQAAGFGEWSGGTLDDLGAEARIVWTP